MGNRATVIFTDGKDSYSPAVYLHWNGGPESVYAFLEELDRRKQRCDQDYECARFIQLIGEFFDQESIGSTSLGVANGPDPRLPLLAALKLVQTDHSDNGFYIVNRTGGSTIQEFEGQPRPMTVRRFTQHYTESNGHYVSHLEEMPANEVQAEMLRAKSDKYAVAMRETFAELQRGRKIEGR